MTEKTYKHEGFCVKCGAAFDTDDNYCGKCGHKLRDANGKKCHKPQFRFHNDNKNYHQDRNVFDSSYNDFR